ncbi:MAG: hypothetical protein KJ067_17735 [Vicinamibacteria bacterium]|nr:hypothetical protein [Vicinamibacteria bacterium]
MPRALGGLAALLLVLAAGPAAAQQYVWSVPSADVLDRGSLLFEGYAYWGPQGPDAWYLGPRATFGLGHRMELGVNLTANVTPVRDLRLELALKGQAWRSQDERWTLSGGGIAYVPLHGLDYAAGAFGWAHLTRSFASGASVSAGFYGYTRGVIAEPGRRGVALALEHPVSKRWTLGADWMSGPEGYTTAGVFYEVNPALYASAGYVFGNEGLSDGNHYLLLALSWYPR